MPAELDKSVGSGCNVEVLRSLPASDAVEFMRRQGVRGDSGEISDLCGQYGNHPLALRLLGGVIAYDPQTPADLAVAARFDAVPVLIGRKNHILQIAYEVLQPNERLLISKLAAFRAAVPFEGVQQISPFGAVEDLKKALVILRERGLLHIQRNVGKYDMHPVVREFAFRRLVDKKGTARRLVNYFGNVPIPAEISSLEDIEPVKCSIKWRVPVI